MASYSLIPTGRSTGLLNRATTDLLSLERRSAQRRLKPSALCQVYYLGEKNHPKITRRGT